MIDTCIITKRKFDDSFKLLNDPMFRGHKYFFKPVGIVYITEMAENIINNDYNISVVAGLCRSAYELKKTPPMIDTELLKSLDTLKYIPRNFMEKYNHFLLLLFKTGGSEYMARTIKIDDDYPLAFANDSAEFQRIVDFAINSNDLECSKSVPTEARGKIEYSDLRFTSTGFKKINKITNNYFSIVQPIIDSGNTETDQKINHACSLFYQENSTIEDKRSACEELSYILEPFRRDLTEYFVDKDVNLFFQLVNDFDIRHNKEYTKKIIYEEQIEWVFKCLLNTLVTYIIIRNRR